MSYKRIKSTSNYERGLLRQMYRRSNFAFVGALILVSVWFSREPVKRVSAQDKADSAGQRERGVEQAPQNPAPNPTLQHLPKQDEVKAQDSDVVRVDTNLVNVFFTAVDRNRRFVTALKPEDISVTEDGVAQEIFTFQRETDRPLSLAILIDVSASQQQTLPDEKAAARAFVNTVIRSGKDEVAIISFTGEATLEQGLTGRIESLQRAIEQVEVVLPPGYIG